MSPLRSIAFVISLPVATAATADQNFVENVNVQDQQICIGPSCVDSEPIQGSSRVGLKMKGSKTGIWFDDTSTLAGDHNVDWFLHANPDLDTGDDAFILLEGSGDRPFHVQAGAGDNALFVASGGNIGIGTSMPLSALHLTNTGGPAVVLEQTGGTPQIYAMAGNEDGFRLIDFTAMTIPVAVEPAAPEGAVYVQSNGSVGFGTKTPNGGLELSTEASFNFFRISATGAAVNESVDITFTGGPLGTGQLRYNIVDGDNQEMSLDANGNMVLDGTLTTAGPTCAGGCDRVFDADYPLPSIADHAAQMWDKGYLPSVGPTFPHVPVNLTERQARMLNALEHAHIFIALQNDELQRQDMALRKADEDITQLQLAFETQREQLNAQAAVMSELAHQLAQFQTAN